MMILSGCLEKNSKSLSAVEHAELSMRMRAGMPTSRWDQKQLLDAFTKYYRKMGFTDLPETSKHALDYIPILLKEHGGSALTRRLYDHVGLTITDLKAQAVKQNPDEVYSSSANSLIQYLRFARLVPKLRATVPPNVLHQLEERMLFHLGINDAKNIIYWSPLSRTDRIDPVVKLLVDAGLEKIKALEFALEARQEIRLGEFLAITMRGTFELELLRALFIFENICTSTARLSGNEGTELCRKGIEAFMIGFKKFEASGKIDDGRAQLFQAWEILQELRHKERELAIAANH
jgi:hypothetical protein